jgi:hypothetical protein
LPECAQRFSRGIVAAKRGPYVGLGKMADTLAGWPDTSVFPSVADGRPDDRSGDEVSPQCTPLEVAYEDVLPGVGIAGHQIGGVRIERYVPGVGAEQRAEARGGGQDEHVPAVIGSKSVTIGVAGHIHQQRKTDVNGGTTNARDARSTPTRQFGRWSGRLDRPCHDRKRTKSVL